MNYCVFPFAFNKKKLLTNVDTSFCMFLYPFVLLAFGVSALVDGICQESVCDGLWFVLHGGILASRRLCCCKISLFRVALFAIFGFCRAMWRVGLERGFGGLSATAVADFRGEGVTHGDRPSEGSLG